MLMGVILIVGVVVVTIGLGFVNYYIGKHGAAPKIGAIIPVGYFAVRVLMALVKKPNLGQLFVAMIPAAIIAAVYYQLYRNGIRRRGA